MRPWVVAALWAAAACAVLGVVFVVGGGAGDRVADRGAPPGVPTASVEPPPPPGLRGTGAPRELAGGGTTAPGSREGADGTEGAPAPRAPLPPGTATPAERAAFEALAPGKVPVEFDPGSLTPIPVPRSFLVGKVGEFGVRDPGTAGARTWTGVARVEHDPSAPSEGKVDAQDPTTTAVKGVVVAEDGSAIAGAEVILYSSFYVRQDWYDHRVLQIGRARSDGSGAFDVRPIAIDTVHFGSGGDLLVTVRHPLYADIVAQALPAIVPGRESDVGRLVLPREGVALHGVVADLAGRPVEGAIVRVSGMFDPISCDKTERMVVLDECPWAVTDALGRYEVGDFAAGVHEVSVHIRIDCVLHVRAPWAGNAEWSPRVRAGNSVKGRVLDADGQPLAAAVVAGGGNWTPTNADGTFWLDNVFPGPLRLEVAHHAWLTKFVDAVPTNGDDVTISMDRRLPRITLTVTDADHAPVSVVAIDWTWPPGGGPGQFSPVSRYWHDPHGVFAIIVPEGAVSATVSDAHGASYPLAAPDLVDGVAKAVALVPPAPPPKPR